MGKQIQEPVLQEVQAPSAQGRGKGQGPAPGGENEPRESRTKSDSSKPGLGNLVH